MATETAELTDEERLVEPEVEAPKPAKRGRSKAEAVAERDAAIAAGAEDDVGIILEIEAFAPKRPKMIVRTNPEDETEFVIVELHIMKEWGVETQYQMRQDGEKFQTLWDKEGLTEKEKKVMKVALDRLFTKIVVTSKDFTAKQRDALDDDCRQAVVTAFTYAPQLMDARRRQAAAMLEDLEDQDEDDDSTTET